jgi:hypothetical protein
MHKTKSCLSFQKYEQKRGGQYTFRQSGWMVRVAIARVKDSANLGRNATV